MNTLKLAIIGTGHLGSIHARLAKNLQNVELVGVCDPVPAACQKASEETGAPGFTDYRELIGKIDAAIVATPTTTHHSVGSALLEQGIHVLVEKPIATDSAEANELVAAAEKHGAILQVGHVERFNPALERVLPQIQEPKYINATRTSGYPFRSTDIGVVLDLMIHDLDVVLSLAKSEVTDVQAVGISVLGQHEDMADARVTFANGCVANLTASRVSYRMERAMEIFTPRSFVMIDFGLRTTTVVQPNEAILGRTFDLDTLTGEQRNHLKTHLFDEVLQKETVEGAQGNAIADEQQDFVESIRAGRAPRVTGAQGRDVLVLAEQILESIASHAWDGTESGRIGPFAAPARPILRGPHWDMAGQSVAHREAG